MAGADFVDPSKLDFRLRLESPVFKKILGFTPIPFEQIGFRKDAYRTALPPSERSGTPAPSGLAFNSHTDMCKSNQ